MGKKSSRGKKRSSRETEMAAPVKYLAGTSTGAALNLIKAKKLPEDPVLREIIVGIVGERGYEIAKEFMKKEITDEKAAKKLDIHVNHVRKVLYALYENRVAGYRRAREEESGWYVYYWRIDPERALEYFNNNKHLLLQKLEERLEAERGANFFSCGDGGHKLSFESAAENDFKCPRCGGRMEPYDNVGVVKALEHKVELLREQLIQKNAGLKI